jgi:hypothetical protein
VRGRVRVSTLRRRQGYHILLDSIQILHVTLKKMFAYLSGKVKYHRRDCMLKLKFLLVSVLSFSFSKIREYVN